MRLFTGIDLPAEVVARLEEVVERLKPTAPIRWSPPANLHITSKFIGEWPEERLDEMKTTLACVPQPGAIKISIEKLGFFPNPHSPRIFWAGVKAADGLAALAQSIDDATASLGVAKETRPYSPHLTMARISTPGRLPNLLRAVAELPSLEFGAFTADRFWLYLSRPGGAGSVYTKLAEFPLAH